MATCDCLSSGFWSQGFNEEVKLGWLETLTPGDAFVQQTNKFWIFCMGACLFGHLAVDSQVNKPVFLEPFVGSRSKHVGNAR